MNLASASTTGLRALVLATAVLACTAPLQQASAGNWGWNSEKVQGNGAVKQQSRTVEHFTGIGIGVSGDVDVRTGTTDSITIETDENLLPLIETVVERGTLQIRPVRKNLELRTRSMKVVVTAREVSSISLGSSGNVTADVIKGSRASLVLGGSGNINVKTVDARDTSLVLGGSGKLAVGGGTTDKVSITIGGSGDVEAAGLKSRDVSVTIGGSGDATVWASDNLSATIAGSGDVNYYGDPRVSKNVLGSGGTKRLGASPK